MKRTIYLTIALVMLLGSSLSACSLEDTCSPGEVYIPTNLSPNSDTPLVTLLPRLSWSYPEGCDPESFTVDLFVGYHYAGSHVSIYQTEVPGSERSVVVGPLTSGTVYSWLVSTEAGGTWAHFVIGPRCSEADRASYTPPTLVSPADGEVIDTALPITVTHEDGSTTTVTNVYLTFFWRNSMSCLPPEGFTVEYSDNARFSDTGDITMRRDVDEGTSTWDMLWDDEEMSHWYECERIYWRVLIGDYLEGSADPYAEIYAISETNSFIVNTSGAFCMPDFGWILTPIPWMDVPIPGFAPTAATLENANCREGPTPDFPVLSILPAGGQYEIQARNTPGDAWLVFDPAISYACWVADDLVDVLGDTSGVPIIDPEPPLTPEPGITPTVDCSQWNTDSVACNNNPACEWVVSNMFPNGECKNK